MYIDIDKYLKKGAEDDLLKAIKERKEYLAEEAAKEAKRKEEEDKKARKIDAARAKATNCFKTYIETISGTEMSESDLKLLHDTFAEIEKRFVKPSKKTKKSYEDILLKDIFDFFM